MKSIVSDTTALIVLGKLDSYELLKNHFEKIYIPKAVMDELSIKSDGIDIKILDDTFFETKELKDKALYKHLSILLDRGEAEAIVLAKELDSLLLIDEKKGRVIAKSIDIKIIGLLGILLLNVKKRYKSKDEIVVIYEKIKKLNFRVSKKLDSEFLKALDSL